MLSTHNAHDWKLKLCILNSLYYLQCSADVSQLWQQFLSAKDLESSLVARLGGDASTVSSASTETGNRLTR